MFKKEKNYSPPLKKKKRTCNGISMPFQFECPREAPHRMVTLLECDVFMTETLESFPQF